MQSAQSSQDAFNKTVEQGTAAWDYFKGSLATANFSNFFSNLDTIIDKAGEAYDALDKLGTSQIRSQYNYANIDMYPSVFLERMGQRTDCDTSAISRLTDERCIRQSVTLVITHAKWGLPKPERRKAMETVPENPARQRSFRSSPSRVTLCTWRREAVISFQYNQRKM
jgi:hypothetical protein